MAVRRFDEAIGDTRAGTLGVPVPGYELTIVRDDGGAERTKRLRPVEQDTDKEEDEHPAKPSNTGRDDD